MSARAIPRRLARLALALLGLLGLLAGLGIFAPGCRVGYVVRSAWYQGELLASRQSFAKVRARSDTTPRLRAGLDLVEDIKAFGQQIGLKPTKAYQTVAVGFNHQMWNISACPPLSFQAKTWWFPIVGRVPYLGFFRTEDADAMFQRLEAQGLDVYRRRIGTYSSLGWFGDPLFPAMLNETPFDLASVVLHEGAHATVWIPGSVSFNESFASFVGDEAALRYIEARRGADAPELRQAREGLEDNALWHSLERQLTQRLQAVYQDPALSDVEKLARKGAIFQDWPTEVAAASFHDPTWAVQAANTGIWNNGRLVQFLTYNENRSAFEVLLARNNGDLAAFMVEVKRVAGKGPDPFKAIEAAAAAR